MVFKINFAVCCDYYGELKRRCLRYKEYTTPEFKVHVQQCVIVYYFMVLI